MKRTKRRAFTIECAECSNPIDLVCETYIRTMDYTGHVHFVGCFAKHLRRPETWQVFACPGCRLTVPVPDKVTGEILTDPLFALTLGEDDIPGSGTLYSYTMLKHLDQLHIE